MGFRLRLEPNPVFHTALWPAQVTQLMEFNFLIGSIPVIPSYCDSKLCQIIIRIMNEYAEVTAGPIEDTQ